MVMSGVNPMAKDWKYQNKPLDGPRKTQGLVWSDLVWSGLIWSDLI